MNRRILPSDGSLEQLQAVNDTPGHLVARGLTPSSTAAGWNTIFRFGYGIARANFIDSVSWQIPGVARARLLECFRKKRWPHARPIAVRRGPITWRKERNGVSRLVRRSFLLWGP